MAASQLSHRQQPYFWTPVTENAPFAARDGAGALVFRDRMWLLGGWKPPRPCAFPPDLQQRGLVFHRRTGFAAEELPEAPWEGRHTAGYAVHDGSMWIIGGDPLQGHYQNDVWRTDDGCAGRK